MALFSLAVVLLRIFAITLLVQGIDRAGQVWPLLWSGSEEWVSGVPAHLWGAALGISTVVMFAAAAFLLLRTESIARFLCKGQPIDGPLDIKSRDLAVVGFSILGLYCFIRGVPGTASLIARWRSGRPVDLQYDGWHSLVFILFGLALFVTPGGFVRIAGWLRRAGAPEPPTQPPA